MAGCITPSGKLLRIAASDAPREPEPAAGPQHAPDIAGGGMGAVDMFPDLIGEDQVELPHLAAIIPERAGAGIVRVKGFGCLRGGLSRMKGGRGTTSWR